jgi:NOL1/NOP2/fmu family ribosome biogenesis protein
MIEWFLGMYPEYEVVQHSEVQGVSYRIQKSSASGSIRIWPHIHRGDGHFCVHLKRNANGPDKNDDFGKCKNNIVNKETNKEWRIFLNVMLQFMSKILTDDAYSIFQKRAENEMQLVGDQLHLHSFPLCIYDGLSNVKMGLFPGVIKAAGGKKLFVPSHSLALSLQKNQVRPEYLLLLTRDDERLLRYLKGETISLSEKELEKTDEGEYLLICVDKYPLGFGKREGQMLKNIYPKSWRIM